MRWLYFPQTDSIFRRRVGLTRSVTFWQQQILLRLKGQWELPSWTWNPGTVDLIEQVAALQDPKSLVHPGGQSAHISGCSSWKSNHIFQVQLHRTRTGGCRTEGGHILTYCSDNQVVMDLLTVAKTVNKDWIQLEMKSQTIKSLLESKIIN